MESPGSQTKSIFLIYLYWDMDKLTREIISSRKYFLPILGKERVRVSILNNMDATFCFQECCPFEKMATQTFVCKLSSEEYNYPV